MAFSYYFILLLRLSLLLPHRSIISTCAPPLCLLHPENKSLHRQPDHLLARLSKSSRNHIQIIATADHRNDSACLFCSP